MRILVDQSGYSLLNVGDIAMLQACVRRLTSLWPEARIAVVTESPERLARFCPGLEPVAPTAVGRFATVLPKSSHGAAEHISKIIMPLLDRSHRRNAVPATDSAVPPNLRDAVRRADIVLSSGGGFVNDVFWFHGAGVLSVLAMAQRAGKPTAMFGQGIGPLTHPVLRRLVKLAIPRLDALGLREGLLSRETLGANGVAVERAEVTGDDALLLTTPSVRPPTGEYVGVNIRVAPYSRVAKDAGGHVMATIARVATDRGVPMIALPVDNNKNANAVSDYHAIRTYVEDADAPGASDIETPEELIARVARCRAIVTGSYHAAVFGLAAGVPAICVSNSDYYDGKFHGLGALFPGGCHILRPGPDFATAFGTALQRCLDMNDAQRDRIHAAALGQVATTDALYQRFFETAAHRTRTADSVDQDVGERR